MSRLAQLAALLPGTMLPTANPSPAGNGWLLCDGAAVSRSTYAALFAVIGTAFGVGDGTTTFNLPDLRGRSIIGVGQGSGLTNRALAASGGAETHTLDTTQIPLHGHPTRISATTMSSANTTTTGGIMLNTSTVSNYAEHTGTPSNTAGDQVGGTGGGTAHNNMQPFLALNWVIKT